MSDETDHDSKTEEPTEKRLQDAAEKGNDPVSREIPLFASLVALLVVCGFLLQPAGARVARAMAALLDLSSDLRLESAGDALTLLWLAFGDSALTATPIFVVIIVFGLAASGMQSPPRLIASRIAPQWSRISPASGFSRLFGGKGVAHFLTSIAQLAIVGFALWLVLQATQTRVLELVFKRPDVLPEELVSLLLRLLSTVAAAAAVVVSADFVWTRFKWRRDLRMSKQEVKDELKQSEGDPMVKARLRSVALDRARKRMMAQVPRATLVIANPTHYAIAIRYLREEGGVPIVVAKGQDLIALKIREIAQAAGVPIVEQKLLARSMYDLVEIDRAIPPEFYRAVAELIFFLSRKTPSLMPAR